MPVHTAMDSLFQLRTIIQKVVLGLVGLFHRIHFPIDKDTEISHIMLVTVLFLL